MSFADDVLAKAKVYIDNSDPTLKGQSPSVMLVDFVIEKYKQHRNYPLSFSVNDIDDDCNKHLNTVAMAVVDVFMKQGAEGETNHVENSVTRHYKNAYISDDLFCDILPFVKTI